MMENRTNREQVLDAFIQSGAGVTDEEREKRKRRSGGQDTHMKSDGSTEESCWIFLSN